MIEIRVHGEHELTRMALGIANGPDYLRENLGRAVRRAAQPVLRDVKRAIEINPIRGFRKPGGRRYRGPSTSKGLRRAIAAVVKADVNVGTLNPRARFVVHTGRLGRRRRLPELIESGKVWRHPVLGNRHAWVGSQGKPWFEVTVTRHRPTFSRNLDQATDRTARQIERRG